MPQPGRFRVSIGELAGFVALTGLVLAPRIQLWHPGFDPYTQLMILLEVALASVFYCNRRLSRWTWLILASLCLRPMIDQLWHQYRLAHFLDPTPVDGLLDRMIQDGMSHFFLALFIAGLALMFRDIRHKLAAAESARLATDPARPPDGDAAPADVS